MPHPVKINRDDPRRGAGPFANLVKGDAVQITQNGQSKSGEMGTSPWVDNPTVGMGARPHVFFEPVFKDGGNRSGQ